MTAASTPATSTPTIIELDQTPDMGPLLAKVAAGALSIPRQAIPGLGGSSGGSDATLPDTTALLRDVSIDPSHVAEYADVCGFRYDSILPPTYLHMLGFPISLLLMTRSDFPFGLLGLVHVRNRITLHRPVTMDQTVDINATVTNLRPHPKGRQMDNVVTVSIAGDTVWKSVSTYLKRGSGADDDAGRTTTGGADGVEVAALPLTANWSVPADIGRAYGSVSGDRNPIHMSALSAKAFGFKRAIAHGMWTKARCLAELEGRIPYAAVIDVAFKLPLYLPGKVQYATNATQTGWAFGVRSRDGRPHLAGVVESPPLS